MIKVTVKIFNADIEIVARRFTGKILRLLFAIFWAPQLLLIALVADGSSWAMERMIIFANKIINCITKFEVSPKERTWKLLTEKQNDVDNGK